MNASFRCKLQPRKRLCFPDEEGHQKCRQKQFFSINESFIEPLIGTAVTTSINKEATKWIICYPLTALFCQNSPISLHGDSFDWFMTAFDLMSVKLGRYHLRRWCSHISTITSYSNRRLWHWLHMQKIAHRCLTTDRLAGVLQCWFSQYTMTPRIRWALQVLLLECWPILLLSTMQSNSRNKLN